MSKIKVTVKDLDQANEIIEYWKDKAEIEIVVKENTTTENSDVVLTIGGKRITDFLK